MIIGSDGKKARMTAAVDEVKSAAGGARPSCSVPAAAAAPFDLEIILINLNVYFLFEEKERIT
jgi:hypothetical protein